MDVSKKQLTVLDQISASSAVRKKTIDAASLLYAKKGFTATSIEEISERAGVSLPVTYRYAGKKMAFNIMMMAHMWVLKRWRFRRRLTLEEFVERQLDLILAFLCPEPAASPSAGD